MTCNGKAALGRCWCAAVPGNRCRLYQQVDVDPGGRRAGGRCGCVAPATA
nr:hypothetical protein [Enterobacter sp.]